MSTKRRGRWQKETGVIGKRLIALAQIARMSFIKNMG